MIRIAPRKRGGEKKGGERLITNRWVGVGVGEAPASERRGYIIDTSMGIMSE